MQDNPSYVEFIQVILFFGLIGVVLLWIAKSKGYFVLPHSEGRKHFISLQSLLIVFAIYLGMTMLVAPLFVRIVHALYGMTSQGNPPIAYLSWIQLFTLLAIFLLFYLYSKAQEPELFKKVWKDWSIPNPKPPMVDFLMGVMTWFFAFPFVIAIGQFADALLYFFFGFESFEQVAVRYLKETLESPPMLAIALFMILFAAPVIEEFLFRGCLQTFFKRYMVPRKAIVLSAFCFALFHFAPSQGIGNFSLIASLFTFALFLGFIYERQASLFASIGLHMTFNAVSTFRIIFFPDS
jgi:membrane protease YdiL (CAAX protease family)